jgi:hypothetical protein
VSGLSAKDEELEIKVKTYLALKEIDNEVKADPKSPLAARRSEIQSRMHNIQREYSYNVRRMYHLIYAGTRRIDLGQPVSGNETLGNWYWRELSSNDVGAIVEHLHYRMIANRVMAGNQQVALDKILDQFYKNTDFPAPSSPDVVARAIQLGVQDGAFGLALAADGEVRVEQLRFAEVVALGAIAFEPGIYLVSQARCEALREELRRRLEEEEEERRRRAEEQQTIGDDDSSSTDDDDDSGDGEETGNGEEEDNGQDKPPAIYKRLRLVIGDIPASRIADVNRGIFMPLSTASDRPLTFTMTIEVHSEEGVTPATLENKVKETVRQIGARIVEEQKEPY